MGKKSQGQYSGGPDIILLTMRGAIKFNASKESEGGRMIASALIERDDLIIQKNMVLYFHELLLKKAYDYP